MTITMKDVRQAADRLRERGGSSCVFTMHQEAFVELTNDPEFRAYHQTRDSMKFRLDYTKPHNYTVSDSMGNRMRVYGVEFCIDDTKPNDAVMTATVSQTVPVQTVE